MHLSDEVVEEFRALYEQEFGEVISKDDATIRAQEIVALYEKLYEAGVAHQKSDQAASPQISA